MLAEPLLTQIDSLVLCAGLNGLLVSAISAHVFLSRAYPSVGVPLLAAGPSGAGS